MAFDLSALATRDQLKQSGIALGVGVLVVAGIYYLGLAPLMKAQGDLAGRIEAKRREFELNKGLIAQAERVSQEHAEVGRTLYRTITHQLAPAENTVSWVSSVIHRLAPSNGVAVRKLSEGGMAREMVPGRDAAPPLFEEFRVSFDLRAGFHNFGRFLADLEETLPYARIESLTIQQDAQSGSREVAITVKYAITRFTEEGFPVDQQPRADAELEGSES